MQANHIRPLTGIRFFAAAWVVSYHFHPWMVMLCPFLKLLNPFWNLGYEAVPLFFLLSGFILSHNYFAEYSLKEHPKFIFLRFARLWPVHFVTLMLLIASPGLIHIKWDTLKSLAEELFMVRSWYHSEPAWNTPAWSISAEWFAYICVFPLAFYLFKHVRRWPSLAIVVTLFLAAQASPLKWELFTGQNKCGTIFFLFLAGSGLYRMRCLLKDPPAKAIVTCGLLLFAAYVMFNQNLSEFVLYVAFALLIFGLSYERGYVARLLSTRLIVYGGLASYSLYMTHFLIIQTWTFYSWSYWETIPKLSIAIRLLLLLLMAGVFIAAAVLFYRCIEEPANRRLRQLLGLRSGPLKSVWPQRESAAHEKIHI